MVLRQAYQESGGMRHDGYQGQSHQSWIHQSIQKLKSNYDKILPPLAEDLKKLHCNREHAVADSAELRRIKFQISIGFNKSDLEPSKMAQTRYNLLVFCVVYGVIINGIMSIMGS